MSLKESNEITVKIKCELNEFYKIVKEKGFKIIDKFSMDDTYFIPEEVDLDKINTRDILSKAVLVRDIIGKLSNRRTKLITFKIKNFDESGNILNQEAVNCDILEIEDAKKLLKAIGNLNENQRTTFLMHRIDGKKYHEIAQELNISVKAVEKRIHNALVELRKEINHFK